MANGRLTYDGTTYDLPADAVADLLARGVIVRDELHADQFELSREHVIAEVEPFAIFDGYVAGDDARGESSVEGRRRLFAVSFQHRDGQGGAH